MIASPRKNSFRPHHYLLFLFLGFCGCLTSANFVEGDKELSFLNDQDKLRIEFDHSNTSVGSFADEEDYIEDRRKEKNAKEEGKGDEWAEEWRQNKGDHFEPAFVMPLDKAFRKKGVKLTREERTPYKLIVRVERIEPGYYEVVGGNPASVLTTVEFVKRDNEEDPLTVLQMEAEGGGVFSTRDRVKSAFRESANYYARYVEQNMEAH